MNSAGAGMETNCKWARENLQDDRSVLHLGRSGVCDKVNLIAREFLNKQLKLMKLDWYLSSMDSGPKLYSLHAPVTAHAPRYPDTLVMV